ncbi:MAG: DUF4118 domain-containing protein [Myxococcales bacterium]|nr:DUF4118 domain-containing protein [Myxococcales bacterium]
MTGTTRGGPSLGERLGEHALGALAVALATALVWLIRDHVAEPDRVMVFLLAVGLVAFRVRLGPALVTALLSVAAYDLFFVEPFFTFAVDDARYMITFVVMASVGAVLSSLTARLRLQARQARDAEARTAALYQLSHELVAADDAAALATTAASAIAGAFDADVSVYLLDREGAPSRVAQRGAAIEARPAAGEGAAGELARRGELGLPLIGQAGELGVVMVRPRASAGLDDADARRLLGTFVGQIALALERTRLAAAHQEAERIAEVERLRSTLLSSVSHDLRTPLGSIMGSATTLLDRDAQIEASTRRELLHAIHDEADRLARLLNNLLAMTRIEGGGLQVRREWEVPEEVVGAAIRRLGAGKEGRELRVTIAPEIELVAFDALMIELVLINLLDNALKYSPAGAPIEVEVRGAPEGVVFAIRDRGPGVPADERGRLFDKLYRGAGVGEIAGAGLGLAIARALVEAHGGAIRVAERGDGPGAVFEFTLPNSPQPLPGVDDDGGVSEAS